MCWICVEHAMVFALGNLIPSVIDMFNMSQFIFPIDDIE